MSRFVKIYPSECIGDCAIGITEISPELDQEGWPVEGIRFIRFECFILYALARDHKWDGGVKSMVSSEQYPVYLARGHRHSLRDIFWGHGLDPDEETTDIEQAQPFLTGYIDDDGARQITNLLDRLYDIAKELLSTFHEWEEERKLNSGDTRHTPGPD
jgi:hypothetical protein